MTASRPSAALAFRALAAGLAFLAADGATGQAQPEVQPNVPPASTLQSVPLGEVAGAAATQVPATIHNPMEGNAEAVTTGRALFLAMNCASCHGYDAKGGMGPDLTDKSWRYGGTPASIFNSISEGRPQGMPSWKLTLPPSEIWRITAYVESLGGSFAADFYQRALEGDRQNTIVSPGVKLLDDIANGQAGGPAAANGAPPGGGGAQPQTPGAGPQGAGAGQGQGQGQGLGAAAQKGAP